MNNENIFNKIKNTKIKKFILIKKLIKLFTIFTILSFVCYFMSDFFIIDNAKKRIQINQIENNITEITNKAREIERKTALTRSYITTWENEITEMQKQRDGIDIESVKQLINDITKEHLIENVNISFSMPMEINNIQKKISRVVNTEIVIMFNCLTEYSIYYFLNELYKSNYAFFLIEELEIKKIKNVDKDLLKKLIVDGNADLLSVIVKLQWYEFI